MALFKRRSDNPDDVQALRAEIAAMSSRLAEADARAKKAESLTTAPTPGRDIDSLIDRVETLATRVDDVDSRVTSVASELTGKINDTDARVSAVSGELASQIEEIGRDSVPVEQLREAQVRLANEQARYQIQFRQDLVEFAERLRAEPHASDAPTG